MMGARPTVADDNLRNLWTGLLYVAVGLGFAGMALGYPLGTVARIGPGYFPLGLGLLLAAIGGVMIASAHNSGRRTGAEPAESAGSLRVAVLISASVVAFGLLVRPGGLALAVVALVAISSLAAPKVRPLRAVIFAIALAGLAWAIFILALGLPLSMLPPAFG